MVIGYMTQIRYDAKFIFVCIYMGSNGDFKNFDKGALVATMLTFGLGLAVTTPIIIVN